MQNTFFGKHVLSVTDFSSDAVTALFSEVDHMKEMVEKSGSRDDLKGKVIAALFYEPSSRTFGSFVTAVQRLGAGFIPLQGMNQSSVAKGESLEDTIRTFGSFADAIVMRHPEVGSVAKAAGVSYIPVINAGDGGGEHPTQALLDAYTIREHFSSFAPITVGLAGDLKHSRTMHSLIRLLLTLGTRKFIFISPTELPMPEEIMKEAEAQQATIQFASAIEESIGTVDVLYTNRIQKERFTDVQLYERVKDSFIITPETMKSAKKNMILMNPLPRIGEITKDVDIDPRAVYLKEQMRNGLYTRMALLKLVLKD